MTGVLAYVALVVATAGMPLGFGRNARTAPGSPQTPTQASKYIRTLNGAQNGAQPREEARMSYEYTDPDGDTIRVGVARRGSDVDEQRVVGIVTGEDFSMVHIPLDRVEELIAGIRDTARQAADGRCGCGEPSTPGTTHRTDGPCYIDDTQETQ